MTTNSRRPPSIAVLAGPNGAGKSTIAPLVLRGELNVTEFINADVIAQGNLAWIGDRQLRFAWLSQGNKPDRDEAAPRERAAS